MTGLSWSDGESVELRITLSNTAPFFNDSRWGDSILWLYENPASPFVGREGRVRRVHYLVKAIDPDGDSVRYTLEGRDAQLFSIDEEDGWLLTRPHVTYDYETEERTCPYNYYNRDPNPCYVVRVRATDPHGASTTQGVTIHLEDKDDRLIQRFRVEAPAGRGRELRLSWSPVSPDERPESYWVFWNTPEQPDYRNYRKIIDGDRTSTTIGSLQPDTVYRVRMRPVFTLEGLAANDNGDELENRRLELKLGYGFGAFGDRFTSTPELGLGLSQGHREYTLGWRLNLAGGGGPNALELALEASRSEATGANDNAPPEHGVGLRVTARW